MNPIARMLLDAVLKEVETHPEVVEQLVHEGILALVSYLKSVK